MDDRKLIKKSDLIIIIVIAAVAAVAALFARYGAAEATACTVAYDGTVVRTVSLGSPASFTVEEAPHMMFEIKDGKVAAIHSDCPDKVCVQSGFIGQTGQKIVCIPNKIVVSLASDAGYADEPDMVAQ